MKKIIFLSSFLFFMSVSFLIGEEDSLQIKSIGNYYIGVSNDRITKNPFYIVGIKGQNFIYKNSPISLILDANFIIGDNIYKNNYGFNFSTGLRLGNSYKVGPTLLSSISMYFDITTGISLINDPITDNIYIGNNSNLSIGLGYKYFDVEFGFSKITTDHINLNSEFIKIQFSYPY